MGTGGQDAQKRKPIRRDPLRHSSGEQSARHHLVIDTASTDDLDRVGPYRGASRKAVSNLRRPVLQVAEDQQSRAVHMTAPLREGLLPQCFRAVSQRKKRPEGRFASNG